MPQSDLRGVRVWLDPQVAVTWTSADGDCARHAHAEEQALLDRAREGLSASGFEVVGSLAAPHETVARVAEHCSDATSGETWRKVVVALDPGDAASGASTYEALSQLVHRPKVLALGRRAASAASVRRPAAPPATVPVDTGPLGTAATAGGAPAAAKATLGSAASQPAAFAIVVGIEKYAGLPDVTGARTDAQRFAEAARQSLGIPADHIRVALDSDATKATILRLASWASTVAPRSGRIYFYFSGHATGEASGGSRDLVPSDGDPASASTAVAEGALLGMLSGSSKRDVLAVIDADFSAASVRSAPPDGGAAVVRSDAVETPGRVAEFVATSELAGSRPTVTGGTSGALTTYLLQALGSGAADIDGDGQITVQELNEWVSPRVARDARREGHDPRPELVLSKDFGAPSAFVVATGVPSK